MTWKDKTCEKCTFRVGDECRRFPVTIGLQKFDVIPSLSEPYDIEYKFLGYRRACAEYAESLDDTGEFQQLKE